MHGYVHQAPSLDYKAYWDLIDHKLEDFLPGPDVSEDQRSGPVNLTQEETTIQILVEEISEELKRDQEQDMRENKEGALIFGYDVSKMSGDTQMFYILAILGFFAAVIYWMYG